MSSPVTPAVVLVFLIAFAAAVVAAVLNSQKKQMSSSSNPAAAGTTASRTQQLAGACVGQEQQQQQQHLAPEQLVPEQRAPKKKKQQHKKANVPKASAAASPSTVAVSVFSLDEDEFVGKQSQQQQQPPAVVLDPVEPCSKKEQQQKPLALPPVDRCALPPVAFPPVQKKQKAYKRVAIRAQALLKSRASFQQKGMISQLDLSTFSLVAGSTNPPANVAFLWADSDLHCFNRIQDEVWTQQFDNLHFNNMEVFESTRYSSFSEMGMKLGDYDYTDYPTSQFLQGSWSPDTMSSRDSESDYSPSPLSSCPASPVLFKEVDSNGKMLSAAAAAASALAAGVDLVRPTKSKKLNRMAGEFCPSPASSTRSSVASVKKASSPPSAANSKKPKKFTMRIMSELEVVDHAVPTAAAPTIRILPGSQPISEVDLNNTNPLMFPNLNPNSALFLSSGISNFNKQQQSCH